MAGNLINFSFSPLFARSSILTRLQELLASDSGIKLPTDNIQSTFASADINLKASIKRIEDI